MKNRIKNFRLLPFVALLLLFFSCTKTETNHFPNGNLMSEIEYKWGKENGISRYYYQEFPNCKELEISMKNGKKEGDCIHYYYTGQVESITQYKNDSIDGIQSTYDWDGTKLSETHYRNGKKHGDYTTWHLNQQMMTEGAFSEGFFDGVWKYYDERGFCIGEGEFQKGTGVHTAYDGNGNLMRITHYKDNLKDGAEISFASNGDTIQHLIFKEDHIIETLLDTINPIMPIDTIQ